MKYKALVSFSGIVTAHRDQVITIVDEDVANDLLEAGYIEPVEAKSKKTKAKDGEGA